jgi:hypothetical protein
MLNGVRIHVIGSARAQSSVTAVGIHILRWPELMLQLGADYLDNGRCKNRTLAVYIASDTTGGNAGTLRAIINAYAVL